MNPLLPWLLILVLDSEYEIPLEPETSSFATYEACMDHGTLLAMTIKVDLGIVGHTIEPKCVKQP